MSGTVTLHVHAGYRQVHLLLGIEALAADPPYPPGQVVTAGQLTLPAARFSPERLAARFPRAAWEAWWDEPSPTPGRYAAFHPQRGPLQGAHTGRWLTFPLSTGWAWTGDAEQIAEVRAAFAAAAAQARVDVVADALAAQDPDHRYAHVNELAAARARAGGIVVGDGPWVLSWDGGDGYTLETLAEDGQALSVLDQVPHAIEAPTRALMYPWADARAWIIAHPNANPRLGQWMTAAASDVGAGTMYPVPLGPGAALGLVRPRTDPRRDVDLALFDQWSAAVSTQLPGCVLVNHGTGTQPWANDDDQAVLLGPTGTDLAAVRGAGRAAAEALGWTSAAAHVPAQALPAATLAAAAAVVRARIAHQLAAQAHTACAQRSETALHALGDAAHQGRGRAAGEGIHPAVTAASRALAQVFDQSSQAGTAVTVADQHRTDTWRAALGHGFSVEQVAALDTTVTGEQVTAALTASPPGAEPARTSALGAFGEVVDEMTRDGVVSPPAGRPRARLATPAPSSPVPAPIRPPGSGGHGISR